MSIMCAAAETAMSTHPCKHCMCRDGDHCKWSDDTQVRVPHHVTWWPIDWDEPHQCCLAPGLDEMEG